MKRFVLIVCLILVVLFMAVPVSALTSTTYSDKNSISTISPSAGSAGTMVDVTITGSNFTTTQGSVWLEKSGEDDINAKVTNWVTSGTQSGTLIECSIKIPKAATTGKWNVVVRTGWDPNAYVVLNNGFTISQAMGLTSISPTSGRSGRDITYTITGTNLNDVAKVYLYNKNYDNITDSSPDTEDTKIKGTFDLTDADEATYDVCIVDIYKAVKCGLEFDVGTNKQGSIDIASSPSGASIFLDGIANGTTPATLDNVIVGSHKVILRKAGYEEWGKTVTVNDGETAEIDAKLYAAATATPATPVPTPIPTSIPRTTRTTVKSTLKVPTTYADIPTTTAASPLDPAIVIGAAGLGIGLVALRRR